jgi:hypothetical protein
MEMILVRRSRDNFARLVEALVLSFIIYAVLVAVLGEPLVVPLDRDSLSPFAVSRTFILGAVVLAVLIPLGFGFLDARDIHMKVLRKLGLTAKTSRDTTWLDVFMDNRSYVIVNLSGQRRVFGWPKYYSNTPEEGLLFLQNPSWIDANGSYRPLDVRGLFLVERGAIESIEFLKLTAENAREDAPRGSEHVASGE